MGIRSKDRRHVPAIYMMGAVIAAAGVMSAPRGALAQSLETVLKRLEALEKENAALRARVNHIEASKGGAPGPATGPCKFKGEPFPHGAVPTSPAPARTST